MRSVTTPIHSTGVVRDNLVGKLNRNTREGKLDTNLVPVVHFSMLHTDQCVVLNSRLLNVCN